MNQFEENKAWSDTLMCSIKRIMGEVILTEAPFEEDVMRNTDLLVLKPGDIRIACRVRRYDSYLKYPNDITIRCSTGRNRRTEIHKIMDGWGDYFFYGFADEVGNRLIKFIVGDLNVFRRWVYEWRRKVCVIDSDWDDPLECYPSTNILENKGSTDSSFRTFNVLNMPEDFVVKSGER